MRLSEVSKKRKKKTLYVCRHLLNADDLTEWARAQGFTSCLPDDDFHVTVVYSKEKVEWEKAVPDTRNLKVKGKTSLEKFGKDKNVVVLAFHSKLLGERNKFFMDEVGCSSDFPDYKSHVTISYNGENIDIDAMEPYEGDLIFGHESFEEINKDSKDDIEEQELD